MLCSLTQHLLILKDEAQTPSLLKDTPGCTPHFSLSCATREAERGSYSILHTGLISLIVLVTLCYFILCFFGVFSTGPSLFFLYPHNPAQCLTLSRKLIKNQINELKNAFPVFLSQTPRGYTRVDKMCSLTESYIWPRNHV